MDYLLLAGLTALNVGVVIEVLELSFDQGLSCHVRMT